MFAIFIILLTVGVLAAIAPIALPDVYIGRAWHIGSAWFAVDNGPQSVIVVQPTFRFTKRLCIYRKVDC